MKRALNLLSLILSMSMALGPTWVWAAPKHIWYLTYHGDQLGLILSTIGLCPLWGEGKNVANTLHLNPQLKERNLDQLKSGEIIYLPISSLPPSEDYEVSEQGELKISYVTPLRCTERGKTQIVRVPHPKFAVRMVAQNQPAPTVKTTQRKIASETPVTPPSLPVEVREAVVAEKAEKTESVTETGSVSSAPAQKTVVREQAVASPVQSTYVPEPDEPAEVAYVAPPAVPVAPVVSPVAPVVAQPPVAQQAPAVQEDDDEMVRSWLGFGGRVSYQKYSGTDLKTGGKAVVLSEAAPGLDVSWTQEWSGEDKTWISLGLEQVSLVKPKNRELVKSKLSLSEAQFGYQRQLSRRFYAGLRLGAEQVATFDALTATTLDFPNTTFLKAGGYLGFKFFRSKKMSLGVQAGVFGNAPASNSNAKFSGGFREREYKLIVDHHGAERMMTGSFYGRTEEYVSPFLKQTQSEMGFELGIHFQFTGN